MTKVCEQKCNQCLFSRNRIVEKKRVKEILEECARTGAYFVCHKSTNNNNGRVCCRGFWDKYKFENGLLRVCERNGWVQFVDPEEVNV
jgi:hypothetical protein